MNKQNSVIITFYSYKGGVGRSMALANVAWLLAHKYGKKVLVVDWDLEAPGLHRFFNLGSSTIKRGLIELLNEYKTLLKEETDPLPQKLVDIEKYITSIPVPSMEEGGSLSIIASGQQDELYASRVNEFDWDEFYEKWHGFGFIEYLKEELKNKAEIVLLDSRTGVTDIGGICTLQLPDIVVLLFALNEQNIAGVEFIVENILKKAPKVERRKNHPILLIRPARVEKYLELKRKNEWEVKASRRLEQYLLPEEREDSLKFMKESAIPYIGAYSFGETLAVKEDPNEDLAKSFDTLTRSVLKAASLWEDPEMQESTEKKDRWFLLMRRFVYDISTSLVGKGWLTVLPVAVIMFTGLIYYSQLQQKSSQSEINTLRTEQRVLEERMRTNEQQLQNRVDQLIKQADELNKRIDELYQIIATPRGTLRNTLQGGTLRNTLQGGSLRNIS
jgi:hypothetical protein